MNRAFGSFMEGTRRALCLTALAGGVAVTMACGGEGGGVTEPPPSQFDLGDFPAGSYTLELQPEEVSVPLLAGVWTNIYGEDGETTVLKDGEVVVFGTFTISGAEITLDDGGGPLTCNPPADVGTYTWSVVEGGGLAFTAVSEPCGGRREVITAGTWTPDP